mmetsp:Transcript_15094/g.10572  ORF Transcript_15094/g.10572 Transcript_15094/m.10572 type:complete len:129 (+) Transcript_15094:908-1294(+)
MRNLHETVVAIYLNPSLTILTAVWIGLAPTNDFMFFHDLDFGSWLLVICLGVCCLIGQMCKFKALQNHEAGKLQLVAYLAIVYQVIIDCSIFNEDFSSIQYIGIFMMFLVYLVYIGFACYDKGELDDN